MKPEIVGGELRIRVLEPGLFVEGSFRTLDVGEKGRLKLIKGKLKKNDSFEVQSYRFVLDDYKGLSDFQRDLFGSKFISGRQRVDALLLAKKYY